MTHPADVWEVRKGFGAIKYYGAPGQEFWGVADPQRDAIFASASPPLFRILKSTGDNCPLGLMSNQDGGTYGVFRFAGGTDRRFFGVLSRAPELKSGPYGAYFAAAERNKPSIDSGGLREAWWVCARQPWALRLYFEQWQRSILAPAIAAWKALRWQSELGLAILTRARNSSGSMLTRCVTAAMLKKASDRSEAAQVDAALRAYAAVRPLYAERVLELLRTHPRLAIRAPSVADLDFEAGPMARPSGSPVEPYPQTSSRLAWLLAGVAAALVYIFRKRLRRLASDKLKLV